LSRELRDKTEMLVNSSKIGGPLNTLFVFMDLMVPLDIDFIGVQETKLKKGLVLSKIQQELHYTIPEF
jgi:hypothetical protein